MKILGIDSSAKTASVSIVEDGKVLALLYSNTGFKHSRTLMPMVQSALDISCLKPYDIDAYAVSTGPGSFTGIRIGVAAIKGMAQPDNKPCVAVSALEAAAYPLSGFDCVAASVMDARREQVYEALFRCKGNSLKRMTDDNVDSIENLYGKLKDIKEPLYFIGDGASLCFKALSDRLSGAKIAIEQIRYSKADSVALLALKKLQKGEAVSASALRPVYLRDSQAQQNLKKQNNRRGNNV